jgi:uncharacterized protein YbjT (DUF2867 family)
VAALLGQPRLRLRRLVLTPTPMVDRPLAVVTGAFSYTGSAVTRVLLRRGWRVRTLTNRAPSISPLDEPLETRPLRFERDLLGAALRSARLLVNTYWVRFPRRGVTFDHAVANTRTLLEAARDAGVPRVAHISVSNPALDSPLAYYRGKAETEQLVRALAPSHAIVRPTLIVGREDILINNIAWFLRRFPFFALPGDGRYRVQPVTLEETGEIVVDAALREESTTVDAAGPEVLSFAEWVRRIAAAVGRRVRLVPVPPCLALALLRGVGCLVRDVILTRQELDWLVSERLVSHEPPLGHASVDAWLREHGSSLGRRYASELDRHFR